MRRIAALSDNVLIAVILRIVSWLYSMPNPQVETYFRDLRDVQDRERDTSSEYVYTRPRAELTAGGSTVGSPTTAVQLHSRS